MIIDELSDVVGYVDSTDSCIEYQTCNDIPFAFGGVKPSNILSAPVNTNIYPHIAMCNGTLIAEKLKTDGEIIIVAIYVGSDADTAEEAYWLREHFVTVTSEGPLFAAIDDYADIQDALMYLFEQLDFIKAR